MLVCPEHEVVIKQVERTAAILEGLQHDMAEVKRDLKALIKVNGDRREALGELKGKLFILMTLVSLAASAAMVFIAEVLLRRK
jgi:hypothetical protein